MKIKKSDLLNMIQEQNDVIAKLIRQVNCHHKDIIRIEDVVEPEPQLKQLDQSVFDGEPEQIKWAVVTNEGAVLKFELEPVVKDGLWHWTHSNGCRQHALIGQYDASNWQNSLIERDTAKELLEVDLSSELTGSDYYYSNITSALLESGSKLVVCFVSDISELKALSNKRIEVITSLDTSFNDSDGYGWQYAVPINNQGEPLTQAEAGF